MKRSIISILAIGFASFALCSCDDNGNAPRSVVGKTLNIQYNNRTDSFKIKNSDTAIIEGFNIQYSYSKKSENIAEINLADDLFELTFETSTNGTATEISNGKRNAEHQFTIE